MIRHVITECLLQLQLAQSHNNTSTMSVLIYSLKMADNYMRDETGLGSKTSTCVQRMLGQKCIICMSFSDVSIGQ